MDFQSRDGNSSLRKTQKGSAEQFFVDFREALCRLKSSLLIEGASKSWRASDLEIGAKLNSSLNPKSPYKPPTRCKTTGPNCLVFLIPTFSSLA